MENDDNIFEYKNGFKAYSHVSTHLITDNSDDKKSPLITIAIPTYKRPNLLSKSVESALSQDINIPFEVIVIDNDSDANMVLAVDEVISSFQVPNLKLFRNSENIGLYGNWNRCLLMARGTWITILNDDDLFDSGFLSRSMAITLENKNISCIFCNTRVLNENLNLPIIPLYRRFVRKVRSIVNRDRPGQVCSLSAEDYFLSNQHAGTLGVFMDRKKAIELGGFFADFYPVSDYLFFVRFMLKYGMYNIKETYVSYRIHKNESIKSENVKASAHRAYLVRKQLANYVSIYPSIAYKYAYLFALNTPTSIASVMGGDINETENRVKNQIIYFQLLFLYSVIRFTFFLQRLKRRIYNCIIL